MPGTQGRIDHRFMSHTVDEAAVADMCRVRAAILSAAKEVEEVTVISRESALAITKLEEAMMWANAAIARDRGTPDPRSAAFPRQETTMGDAKHTPCTANGCTTGLHASVDFEGHMCCHLCFADIGHSR